MSHITPCAQPDSDPNDWYIGRDGKQYPDDELVTEQDVVDQLNEVDPDGTRSLAELEEVCLRLEAEAKKQALIRRRKARDRCHTECYFRTNCLDLAMKNEERHGTWGGYYEEELREIRSEIAHRKKRGR